MEVYDAVHKVGSKFQKDPRVYGEFVQGGHPALFSITDPVEHSKRRRLMGRLFNRSKIGNLESLMLNHVTRWVSLIGEKKAGFDVGQACRALEADIISDFSFGTAIGAVNEWAKGEQLGMVVKNDEKATWMPVLTAFPTLVHYWELLEHFLSKFGWQSTYTCELLKFQQWAKASWDSALSPKDKPSSSPNLIQTLVEAGLPPLTALSEAKENLGPGTDTTSASLAHILWALAHNPRYQDELHKELSEIGFPTDMTRLEAVPKLKAAVKEGIRWAGAAAAMLPRIAPEGGIELLGYFIPEGTVLTSSPIWYLRDANAYPEPELYDPYRWLTPDGLKLSENAARDRFYIPFSKGANICMGNHFSYYELYLSVSQVLSNYKIRTSRELPPQDGKWQPVKLPARKEWVAAVVTEDLDIVVEPRERCS